MNPSRITNADIDTDYSDQDRDRVKEFLLKEKMGLPNIRSAEIITFNTIALKGTIREVARALGMPLNEVNDICKQCTDDHAPDSLRKKYKTLFEYVDIVSGTIVSIGSHASGVLVSDLNIDETVGMCSIASSPYPVSMLNMKELDDLMYVKLDILGLDNIGVINETCRVLGIDRLTPDNIDLEDEFVWKNIRDDTTMVFQWESKSAHAYLKKLMSDQTLERAKRFVPNFSMLKWLSLGNGLIRPACASFRDHVANGEFYDNGLDELNKFLAAEAGRIAMQETIMQFLVKFCGYSDAESDTVRRAIAKKKGTDELLPQIERRFIQYTSTHYHVPEEKCAEVIKPFIQVILDASAYAFSWNHSDPYSIIGYICGYLRTYHPFEFITSALNIFGDKIEKTAAIVKYAKKVGITITSPKFALSKGEYFFSKEHNTISKGLNSVKYMTEKVANELFDVAQSGEFDRFVDVLLAIKNTSVNAGQLDKLIKIDFFSEFGNQRELLTICDMFNLFKCGELKKIAKDKIAGTMYESAVKRHSTDTTKNGKTAKSYTPTDMHAILSDCEDAIKASHLPDIEDDIKCQHFAEIMGYAGYVSGEENDRRKLYIRDIYPLKRKKDGKQFGYSVLTQSIGSGIESRFTVLNRVYDNDPIRKGDIILCLSYQKEGNYFKLTQYNHISSFAK